MNNEFCNQNIVVIGGSSGIGKEVAKLSLMKKGEVIIVGLVNCYLKSL